MSYTVDWLPPFQEAIKRMPWKSAARVCKAVTDYASSGTGEVQRAPLGEYRLLVLPYVVRFTIDTSTQTLSVWSVYSRGA